MTKTTKFSIFIIFLVYTLSACNTNSQKDIDRSFGILGVEIGNKTIFLTDELNMKISADRKVSVEISKGKHIEISESVYDSLSTIKLNRYHKLTKKYVNFLTQIEDQFISDDKNPLIQNDVVTQKGEEYIGRTKLYSEEIQKLWINEFTKNKVSMTLSTEYIQNREGTKISHIAYYFDDLPIRGIVVYLRQKKYNVLALEKDFLNDLIFQNLTKQLKEKK